MEGISDIKMVGIDQQRPPQIRKEPYIELFFKLNHEAPKRWCEEFNHLMGHEKYSIKIDPKVGLFIETWVRKPEEVESLFNDIKANIKICTESYIKKIHAEQNAESDLSFSQQEQGEQGRLNRIIANLDFEK